MALDPTDNYWIVATNPTQLWAGARGIYVNPSDATYIAWTALAGLGNVAVNIATEAELWQVIAQIASTVYLGGQGAGEIPYIPMSSNVALPNPLPDVLSLLPSANGWVLTLPKMNLPTSRPLGKPVRIQNRSSTFYVTFHSYSGGAAVTGIIYPRHEISLLNSSFASVDGDLSGSTISVMTVPEPGAANKFLSSSAANYPPDYFFTLDTDDTFAANLDTNVPSQKAVKTYADTKIASGASAGGDLTGTYPNPTIAAGAVTLAKQANMATASVVYRKTAGSGAPEVNTLATLKTDLGLTGTNSGDQTITLTGDVTGTGTGSFAATIAAAAVTLAKMANMATASLIYRRTAGTGVPEVNTLAQLKTDLALAFTDLSGSATTTQLPTGVGFRAHRNGTDQTGIADSTPTTIQFNVETFDQGNYYNTGTYTWTPPAGTVLLAAKVTLSGLIAVGNYGVIYILKNGTNIANNAIQEPVANDTIILTATVVDTANGTDAYTVQVYLDVTSGTGTLDGVVISSYFSGAVIH